MLLFLKGACSWCHISSTLIGGPGRVSWSSPRPWDEEWWLVLFQTEGRSASVGGCVPHGGL